MIDISVIAENVSRLRSIKEQLTGTSVGDADYDAAYFALEQWIRYSLPGNDIDTAVRRLKVFRGKDEKTGRRWMTVAGRHFSHVYLALL